MATTALPRNQLLYEKLHIAASEYLRGRLTQGQISNKHQVAYSTFRRYLRKNGLKLAPEKLAALRSRAAYKGLASRNQSHPCPPDCTCKRHHHRRRHRSGTPTVVLGRRFCSDCGRWRLLIDFHARERAADGEPIAWQSICSTCQRIRCRHTQGLKRRGKPYEQRRPRMSHQQRLARARERYQEYRKDPEWLELRREYERIYAEGHRRQNGIPRAEVRLANRDPGRDADIPSDPFSLWMEERHKFYRSWSDFAAACGVSERALFRFRTDVNNGGPQRSVTAGFVDRVLQHEGSMSIVTLYSGNIYNESKAQLELVA